MGRLYGYHPTDIGIFGKLSQVEEMVQRRRSLISNPNYINKVLAETAKLVRPMVRQMVLANFLATGIGTKSENRKSTGKMKEAIASTMCYLNLKGGILKVRLSVPSSIDAYDNQNNPVGFYKAFAALNYGAVHGDVKGYLGRKQRISLKKTARGEAINEGASTQQMAGRKVSMQRLQRKLAAIAELGGSAVTLRKAYSFFRLNESQLQIIKSIAMERINQEIQNTLSGNMRKAG